MVEKQTRHVHVHINMQWFSFSFSQLRYIHVLVCRKVQQTLSALEAQNKSEHSDTLTVYEFLLTTFNNYLCDKIHLKAINLIMIIGEPAIACKQSYRVQRAFGDARKQLQSQLRIIIFAIFSNCGSRDQLHVNGTHGKVAAATAATLTIDNYYNVVDSCLLLLAIQLRNTISFANSSSCLHLKQSKRRRNQYRTRNALTHTKH